MSSQTISIQWIPVAKAAWHALKEQQALVTAHVGRLIEKRDRYEGDTIAWASANLEVRAWQQVAEVVGANLAGKTVQPR